MTITTAYSRVLTSDAAMGSSYTYAFEIPDISVSGGACRFRFKAGLGGSVAFSDVWAGNKGVGALDFDGGQKQILVGGQSSWTVPAGQEVWSDPIALVVDDTKSLLCVYDGLGGAGRYYRASHGIAGYNGYFKSGTSGAANGNTTGRSGFTSSAGFTASIVAIEVASDIADFSGAPPPPDIDDSTASVQQMLDGQWHAAGDRVLGTPGEYQHFILKNPALSGVIDLLHAVVITPHADCTVTMRAGVVPAGAVAMPKCNQMFGPGQVGAKSDVFRFTNAIIQGDQHAIYEIRGGYPFTLKAPAGVPLVGLDQGHTYGAMLAIHTPGVGATVSYEWREMPIEV